MTRNIILNFENEQGYLSSTLSDSNVGVDSSLGANVAIVTDTTLPPQTTPSLFDRRN